VEREKKRRGGNLKIDCLVAGRRADFQREKKVQGGGCGKKKLVVYIKPAFPRGKSSRCSPRGGRKKGMGNCWVGRAREGGGGKKRPSC